MYFENIAWNVDFYLQVNAYSRKEVAFAVPIESVLIKIQILYNFVHILSAAKKLKDFIVLIIHLKSVFLMLKIFLQKVNFQNSKTLYR